MAHDSYDSPVKYKELTDSIEPTSSLPLEKTPSIAKWLLGLLALLLLGGASYLTYHQFVKQQQQASQRLAVVPVELSNFTVTVSANGTVQPEEVVNVSPKTAGIVTSLLVDEGDVVRKGQILARMDDSNLQGELLQQQGRLAQAEANLRKLIAGNRPQDIAQAQAKLEELQAKLRKLIKGNRFQDIAQAQARLDNALASQSKAEDDFRRNQKLFDAGAISQLLLNQKRAERDAAKAQVAEEREALSLQKAGTREEDIDQARAEVEQQQQALDLLKAGSRQEDIDRARAEVVSARGALQNVQTQIDDAIVRAPFAGVVNKKYADPGAFVTPMTAGSSVSSATSSSLLALASTNEVVANVAESSISQIRVGQQVVITADAYPGKTFFGKVSQIGTQATVEQNVTSFQVKIAILSDAEKLLRAGMNTSVEFKVAQSQNALSVPTIAVTRQENVTGVLVGTPGRPPRFVPITTGATVNNRTEVKAGLNGSEQILINLPPEPPPPQAGLSFPGLPGSSKADGDGATMKPPPPPPGGGGAPPPGG